MFKTKRNKQEVIINADNTKATKVVKVTTQKYSKRPAQLQSFINYKAHKAARKPAFVQILNTLP